MKSFFHSLQSRLIILIILVTLPGFIGIIHQSLVAREFAINTALQKAMHTVELTANNQSKLIAEAKTFLQNLSSFKFAINPESSECSLVLSEILKLNSNYINLGIPGVDGDLLCNAKMTDKRVNVADRSYFQDAIKNRDFSIGQFQVDRAIGITSINFAYPVINPVNDEIVAVSVAVISLEWWSKYLAESNLPFNSVAYITDHEDNIIATYPDNKKLLGTKLGHNEINTVPLTLGILPFKQSINHSRMFASRPLFENSDLIKISVGIPLNEELVKINKRLLNISGWILIVILMIFITATWAIRKSILTPLKGLLHFVEDLEQGKEITNISLGGSSELVDLQQRFNSMAKTRLLAEQKLKNSEFSLRESENKLKNHIDNTPLGCISWDKDFNCTDWNDSAEKIFGYQKNEALGGKASALIIDPQLKHQIKTVYCFLSEYQNSKYINKSITKDGRTIICEWYNTLMTDKNGNIIGMTSLVQDITEGKLLEAQLKLVANVFTHAKEGIIITNASGNIIDVNEAFVFITGYERNEILGKNPRILKSERQSPLFYEQLWQSLLRNGYWHGEIWNKRKDHEIYPELLTISAVYDDSDIVKNYVGLFTDISDIKQHQIQLEHMAHYDLLTSLPNRVLLADRLNQAILQSQRNQKVLAVAFLDLDGFKDINDIHGHDVGDQLLISIASTLKRALRDGDTLSRFGGDEFVAILTDFEHLDDFKPILQRLLCAASEAITVQGILLKVSVSIGVTLYPLDDAEGDQLIRHADQAMYVAKQKGKNCYHLFDSESESVIKSQIESIQHLNLALENEEFVLYYQPKVNMKTGEVIGTEALIRWLHPVKGILPPASFLPLIENHSLSIKLGEWVISTALKQISHWQAVGLDLPVSVNIGALQLQQQDFVERLAMLLSQYPDVSPEVLQLEVLETSALGDVMDVSNIMNACLELGVSFAIDDFGTGYSSLTYLRRLPAYLIKVDQTFVRDMLIDPEDHAIVLGVIALAHSFNRKVIAEGVETIAHGTELLQLGCELAQGYGIARPMPADEIPDWVNSWQPDATWKTISHEN